MSWPSLHEDRKCVFQGRDFFGVVQVQEAPARTSRGVGCIREFSHGTTMHGIQALLPGKERMPTAYYSPLACGYAVTGHGKFRKGEPMRVCLVGLGLGVMYAYAREGDYYRGYEISPEALSVASNSNLFTFVSGCPAKHDEILEDARKGLEREAAQGEEPYDVLIVDAFSGDSQPYHLSTKEAFALYLRRLKPDGVLCVNISNYHLDLKPFMKAVGDAFALPLMGFACDDDFGSLQFRTTTAFFCRQPGHLAAPPRGVRMIDFPQVAPMASLPTDDRGSFISLVNW